MNLSHRVLAKIGAMVGRAEGEPINAVIALDILDTISKRVVAIHLREQALISDRKAYRNLLTAIAFDFGLNSGWGEGELKVGGPGTLEDLAIIEWPPDADELPPKPEEKKVLAPEPKRLVSLH